MPIRTFQICFFLFLSFIVCGCIALEAPKIPEKKKKINYLDYFPLIAISLNTERLRSLFEPNNSLESATCVFETFEAHVYPQGDSDFYKIRLRSGSLNLLLEESIIKRRSEIGFQIFDSTGKIIYDTASPYDTNANVSANRSMLQSDCSNASNVCSYLGFQYLGFTSDSSTYYVKLFFVSMQGDFIVNQIGKIGLIADKEYRPDINIIFRGDFLPCL